MSCCVLMKVRSLGSISRQSLCKHLCTRAAKHEDNNSKGSNAPKTNADIRAARNHMFSEEKKRQLSLIRRVEKIKVEYYGIPESCTLWMNKDLSSPYNCAMHMKSNIKALAALAVVNGEVWDMHRPLESECSLQFLKFRDNDPELLNKAFWRTGSFLIGYIFDRAFKDSHRVNVIRFPSNPVVEDGYFCCDLDLGSMNSWQPLPDEMRALSMLGTSLAKEDSVFERLEVDEKLALEMFKDNEYKCDQIPAIAKSSATGSKVTLYRFRDYVDLTSGPLVASSLFISQYNIVKMFPMKCSVNGDIVRVQGIALPPELQHTGRVC
ncbi:39S ribosomal protein L39, mitochondrial-like isoform X2 [Ostrea edulis]|uniref:39S ribosomal protein L39, mitochondrial-like isoform X2 n=1 Tax=Ostrea edulis TaxID=37623 RepID=UPI0024AFC795|nr:39S ribosomal protein L39, mitochondrial-like isoform X2 [Ostrea edulis]